MWRELPSLIITAEPDYLVALENEGGGFQCVEIHGRTKWKRNTAIAHARWLALKNPTRRVRVMGNW